MSSITENYSHTRMKRLWIPPICSAHGEGPSSSSSTARSCHVLLLARLGTQLSRKWPIGNVCPFERVTAEDEAQALSIISQYRDKTFSYTDATGFAVMERLGIRKGVRIRSSLSAIRLPGDGHCLKNELRLTEWVRRDSPAGSACTGPVGGPRPRGCAIDRPTHSSSAGS